MTFFFFCLAYRKVDAAPPQSCKTQLTTTSAAFTIHRLRQQIAKRRGTVSRGGYKVAS